MPPPATPRITINNHENIFTIYKDNALKPMEQTDVEMFEVPDDNWCFGFEYETIVKINNPYYQEAYKELTNTLNKEPYHLIRSLCPGIKVALLSSENNKQERLALIHRILLATIINNHSKCIYIKPAKGYHSTECFAFSKPPTKSRIPWALTFDRSVKSSGIDDLLYREDENVKLMAVDSEETHVLDFMEFVSPIISWDNIEWLNMFMNEIKVQRSQQENSNKYTTETCNNTYPTNIDGKFIYVDNNTTSNHVHLSYGNKFAKNKLLTFNAARAWWIYEPLFMMLVLPSRRINPYCESMHSKCIRRSGNNLRNVETIFKSIHIAKGNDDNDDIVFQLPSSTNPERISNWTIRTVVDIFQGFVTDDNNVTTRPDRYAAYNMTNLLAGIPTIEVRLKHGSSDPYQNMMWVGLLILFFDAVRNAPLNILYDQPRDAREASNILYNSWNASEMLRLNPTMGASPEYIMPLWMSFSDFIYRYASDVLNNKKFIDKQTVLTYWKTRLDTKGFDYYQGGARLPPRHKNKLLKQPERPSSPYTYMFSYGSNNIEQIIRRVKRETTEAPLKSEGGYLEDHVRIFAGWSSRWQGAIASVYPSQGRKVHGLLVKLTEKELQIMDTYEGGYRREKLLIKPYDKKRRIAAWVYIKETTDYIKPPSEEYLAAIRKQLDDVARPVRKNIIIRSVDEDGRIRSHGTWTPSTTK